LIIRFCNTIINSKRSTVKS